MILPVAVIILTLRNRPRYLARALDCLKKQTYADSPIYPILVPGTPEISIGASRNIACSIADQLGAGVIIHWDDDDWSAPERIASQVKDLMQPFRLAVGYNRMLFWDSVKGEAWEYSNPHPRYALGTSLCYWTSTWHKYPFADLQTGEDHEWTKRVRPHAAHNLSMTDLMTPLLIAEIHGSNTTSHVNEAEEWKRAPYADSLCREKMKL